MKELIFPTAVFIVLVFGIVACTENEKESLDQDYLDSPQYEPFRNEASEEKKLHDKLNKSLGWHLQQFSDCEVSNLSIPFELDYEKVGGLIMDASEGCIIESRAHRLKMLGESIEQDQKIRWVLIERETAYRDQEVVAATFRDGELRSFKTVGVFRKNPSEKISSEIQTRNDGNEIRIVSRTSRNIFYPIEQNNLITTEYKVSASGDIREL